MSYQLKITPAAQKELRKLDNLTFKRITRIIAKLEFEPRPNGYKKLSGGSDEHRIRVGDYRVIYAISDKEKIVIILTLGHRKNIYK